MELDPFDGELLMSYPHDLLFLRLCRDLQAVRKALPLNEEGVVTDGPKRVGKALLKRLRCEVLVITRGEEGMALFEPNQEPYLVPTVAREVYDVTGAGDTVIGTMALGMAAGVGVKDAARLANHAAGIVVGKVGTATVTQEELAREIKRNF